MKRETEKRRREILEAVLTVMREHGFTGASTAKIAAEANCSKETIYNWFGNRSGLFGALVGEQSNAVNTMLERVMTNGQDVRADLIKIAAALLDLLTGEASLLINRAAIGEIGSSGDLAGLLLKNGRGKTLPLVLEMFERARDQGIIEFDNGNEVFSVFFGLLIGDRQIRALLGDRAARPSGREMNSIAQLAVDRLFLIFARNKDQ